MKVFEPLDLFQKHEDEYLKFNKVKKPTTTRPDLHALNLLDKLFPSKKNIISRSKYQMVYLNITPDELFAIATEDQIIELIRSGVMAEEDSLVILP